MIPVSKEQFEELKKAKLIKFKKGNRNFRICNLQKKARAKTYLVAEEKKIMEFLFPKEEVELKNI